MITDEAAAFYRNHRGGSGAVILVTAINGSTKEQRHGIFGSVELANAWRDHLPDEFVCVYSPYIVDDPEWGNEAALHG